jgi:hypothetical protein
MTIRGETFLSHEPMIAVTAEPSLASKIAFLSRPDSYGDPARTVSRRETHMSWVFLAGDRVFKLKKPVRFPYLDFSTLARREAACRAELRLNRRLAADVYLSVVPLVWTPRGLAIGGSGVTVDWLVVMRRLDEALTLERMILDRCLTDRYLDRLLATLAAFYRHAGPVRITPARHFADWERNLNENRRVLFEPRLALPLGLIRRIDSAQRRFSLWGARSRSRRAPAAVISWTAMETYARSTSGSMTPFGSSTVLNLTRNSGQSTRSMKSPFSASNAITLELHGPAITSDAGACGYGAMARRHRSFASTAVIARHSAHG